MLIRCLYFSSISTNSLVKSGFCTTILKEENQELKINLVNIDRKT